MSWVNIQDAIGTEANRVLGDEFREDIYPVERKIVITATDAEHVTVQATSIPGHYRWSTSDSSPVMITDTLTLMESVTAWCEAHKPS